MYQCKNHTFSTEQAAVKRLMDIGFSLFGILVTSPIMLIAALIIKLQDGGPVFFKQVRYTRNYQKFTLLKFRSMIVDAEKTARSSQSRGFAHHPFGRFMRATRNDELPQFFNILHGEMSLVGPRAERQMKNVDFTASACRVSLSHEGQAGLTGYAQIYGKYNTNFEDKLKLDMLYIENCSIFRDLQLIFMTFKVLFMSEESTEGSM